ncbi:MAG: hypothetical protein ABIR55_08865 [Burkholderiaceae bacterium]
MKLRILFAFTLGLAAGYWLAHRPAQAPCGAPVAVPTSAEPSEDDKWFYFGFRRA